MNNNIITPNWPAPPTIHAFTTTRQQGCSQQQYASFNLAHHVGDDPQQVTANRNRLITDFKLPSEPCWLEQTHSDRAVRAEHAEANAQADASYTQQANIVCAVMAADCLPLLMCNQQGTEVAAIHAGWRGLAAGIIEKTIQQLNSQPSELMVWLGPAIGPKVYQVGQDVYDQIVGHDERHQQVFHSQGNHHYLLDLYQLATHVLQQQQISLIYGGEHCTYTEQEKFYSYRRDGQTGRMASIIWFEN